MPLENIPCEREQQKKKKCLVFLHLSFLSTLPTQPILAQSSAGLSAGRQPPTQQRQSPSWLFSSKKWKRNSGFSLSWKRDDPAVRNRIRTFSGPPWTPLGEVYWVDGAWCSQGSHGIGSERLEKKIDSHWSWVKLIVWISSHGGFYRVQLPAPWSSGTCRAWWTSTSAAWRISCTKRPNA